MTLVVRFVRLSTPANPVRRTVVGTTEQVDSTAQGLIIPLQDLKEIDIPFIDSLLDSRNRLIVRGPGTLARLARTCRQCGVSHPCTGVPQ